MSAEKPPEDKVGAGLGLEVRQISPESEEAQELLAGMRENIAGLEAWLTEKQQELVKLEADPKTPPTTLELLRTEMWELAQDIEQQKEFVKESSQE